MSRIARVGSGLLGAVALSLLWTPSSTRAFGPERGISKEDNPGGIAQALGTPHTVITDRAVERVLARVLGITSPSEANKSAMRSIDLADMLVDDNQKDAQLHVDGETVARAHQRIDAVRKKALTAIVAEDYETARQMIGEALHTVQDFYSHSNWVELGNNSTRHPTFGGVSPMAKSEIAQPGDATCQPCDHPYQDDGCKDNIITHKLTSGYYGGEPEAVKPAKPVKCSHGGPGDKSAPDGRMLAFAEGINKDFPKRPLSPHYQKHEQAVAGATDATDSFLMSIYAGTDEAHFRALFNTAASFAVALDVSESMDDVIGELRNQVWLATVGRKKARSFPGNFIFEAFADSVSSTYEGGNSDLFVSTLNAARLEGGSDCPEVSLDATLKAVQASDPGGVVFVITDADAEHKELVPRIKQLARERKVKIYPMLLETSDGSPCADYNVDVYKQIAQSSGGVVHKLERGAVDQLGDLMTTLGQPAGALTIIKADGSSVTKATGSLVPIALDSSISTAAIAVTGEPDVELLRPNGATVGQRDPDVIKTKLGDQVIFRLTSPQAGTWNLSGQGMATNVQVTTDSSLQITALEFVELRGREGHQGYFPIAGTPTVGKAYDVIVELSSPVLGGAIELRDRSGELLTSAPLAPRPDETGAPKDDGHYSATLTPPAVPFIAYLTGKTQKSEAFVRSPMEVTQAQYVAVTTPPWQFVYRGGQAQYEFLLQNTGAADQFTLHVSDEAGFVTSATQQPLSIGAGETAHVVVSAQVPSDSKIGRRSRINVDVTSMSQPTLITYGSSMLEVAENLDTDNDGALNDTDNCPDQSNPDQLDYDKDGMGNACDPTPGEPPPETGCTAASKSQQLSSWWFASAALAFAIWARTRRKRR